MFRLAATAILIVTFAGCATITAGSAGTAAVRTPDDSRSGFVTEVRDGRLWIFREGSKELDEFRTHGELAKSVTRVGSGPNGITIRAADTETLDAYLAAK